MDIEEKWKTQSFRKPKPRSHEVVEAEWLQREERSPEDLMIEQEEGEQEAWLSSGMLDQLTPRQREAMELVYLEGLSQPEVAKRMSVTQARVSQLVDTALKNLNKDKE